MDGIRHAAPLPGSVVDASIDPQSLLGRLVSPAPIYVRWWGDSITENVANPASAAPGARGTFFATALSHGYNVRPLGTRHTGLIPASTTGARRYSPALGRNEGKSGDTIAQIAARVPTAVAAELARTGKLADVEWVMAGTNAGGLTAAQGLVQMGLLIDALRAANPTGWIVVRSIPKIPTNATYRTDFNAGLPALIATKDSRVLFSDACGAFTDAEMGIVAGPAVDSHPSLTGQRAIGLSDWRLFQLLYPFPNGLRSPRPYAAAPAQSSVSLTETFTQLYWPTNPASVHTPFGDAIGGNTAFVMALDFAPSALTAAARAIFGYANYSSNNGWLVGANGDDISIYAPGSGGAFASGYQVLAANAWQRFWLHYEPSELLLSLVATPDGQPAIVAQGVLSGAPTWATNDYIIVGGFSAGVPAYPGYYKQLELCVGASVPHIDDLLDACRANFFEHAPMPGRISLVPLNEGSGAVSLVKDAANSLPAASVYGAGAGWGSLATPYDG